MHSSTLITLVVLTNHLLQYTNGYSNNKSIESLWQGRGIVVQRAVPEGTLLMVSNPVACAE